MASGYNSWREPIGYTSSFRPVRTPLRLNYGRDDARIKETRGQRFEQRSDGRESTPRTFPMKLRPRELFSPQPDSSDFSHGRSTARESFRRAFTPQVRSSKNLNYTCRQSTPREVFRGANISQAGSSKNLNHTHRRSTPKEEFRGTNTSEVGSSKNLKYTHGRSTPREVFRKANASHVESSKNSKYIRGRSTPREVFRGANAYKVGSSKNVKYIAGRSTPREGFRDANASQVEPPKHSNFSHGHSSRMEEKNTPKMNAGATKKAPPEYMHSRLSTAKKVPDGYSHASSAPSNKAPFDHAHSSPNYRPENGQKASRAKSTLREVPPKKTVKSSDGDTSRRFLRCQSEPPRRSARIANLLKKSDEHKGVKNDEGNSAKSHARSRAVSRPRDFSQRSSQSGSNYKTPCTDYRSASAAPSRYSSGSNSRELQTKAKKKEMQHSHKSRISIEQPSRISLNERINEQSEADRSTNQSLSAMADIHIGSPSASATLSLRDANDLIEDVGDSYKQRDIEHAVVDIVNGVEDVSNSSMQLDGHQGETNEYSNNGYISRCEPQRQYFSSHDNLIRQGYVPPYEPSRQYFVSDDSSRQVLDSLTPFHRRQINVPQSSNNRPDFLSQAGPSHYAATPWQSSSYNYQPSPLEYSLYQFILWQNPYNARMQQNVWNRNSSAQIHSQDGTFNIDEEVYCVNRRVPVDNENET